jgi:hypothetical protein
MKLTWKDKEFLEKLKSLREERELSIELKDDGVKRFVLRRNYGDKIDRAFLMSRQGVRWRFHRLMDSYVSAYETIYFLESNFGTDLRRMALEIARQRVDLRKKAQKTDFCQAYRRETEPGSLK